MDPKPKIFNFLNQIREKKIKMATISVYYFSQSIKLEKNLPQKTRETFPTNFYNFYSTQRNHSKKKFIYSTKMAIFIKIIILTPILWRTSNLFFFLFFPIRLHTKWVKNKKKKFFFSSVSQVPYWRGTIDYCFSIYIYSCNKLSNHFVGYKKKPVQTLSINHK